MNKTSSNTYSVYPQEYVNELQDYIAHLKAENNTLRAELHKAKQEAARFEDAYIRLYKQKVKEER